MFTSPLSSPTIAGLPLSSLGVIWARPPPFPGASQVL